MVFGIKPFFLLFLFLVHALADLQEQISLNENPLSKLHKSPHINHAEYVRRIQFEEDEADLLASFQSGKIQETALLWAELGRLHYEKGNKQSLDSRASALKCFEKALELTNQDDVHLMFAWHLQLALLRTSLGQGHGALDAIHKAVADLERMGQLNIQFDLSTLAHHEAEVYFSVFQDSTAALPLFLRSIELNPCSYNSYWRYVNALQDVDVDDVNWDDVGRLLSTAIEKYQAIDGVIPAVCLSIANQSHTAAFSPQTNVSSDATENDSSILHWALAAVLEKAGRIADSWREIELARALDLPRLLGAPYEVYSLVDRQEKADVIRRLFKKGFWPHGGLGVGSSSQLPVFIVGFFRSGSTLLETMLDAHPKVWAMGEDSVFAYEMVEMQEELSNMLSGLNEATSDDLSAEAIRAKVDEIYSLNKKIIGRQARKILRGLRKSFEFTEATARNESRQAEKSLNLGLRSPLVLKQSVSRIVDKMLANYRHIGLIHLVFPNAVILHTMRDPMDTLLSCYRTRFASDASVWTLDVHTMVAEYVMYLQVMQHFRSELPGRVIDVSYESLVAAPEATMRAILERMELPWDDAVLRPDNNKRIVHTASIVQVRQPLYRSSIGKWRKHYSYLKDLVEVFRQQLQVTTDLQLPRLPTVRSIVSPLTTSLTDGPGMNWLADPSFDYEGMMELLSQQTYVSSDQNYRFLLTGRLLPASQYLMVPVWDKRFDAQSAMYGEGSGQAIQAWESKFNSLVDHSKHDLMSSQFSHDHADSAEGRLWLNPHYPAALMQRAHFYLSLDNFESAFIDANSVLNLCIFGSNRFFSENSFGWSHEDTIFDGFEQEEDEYQENSADDLVDHVTCASAEQSPHCQANSNRNHQTGLKIMEDAHQDVLLTKYSETHAVFMSKCHLTDDSSPECLAPLVFSGANLYIGRSLRLLSGRCAEASKHFRWAFTSDPTNVKALAMYLHAVVDCDVIGPADLSILINNVLNFIQAIGRVLVIGDHIADSINVIDPRSGLRKSKGTFLSAQELIQSSGLYWALHKCMHKARKYVLAWKTLEIAHHFDLSSELKPSFDVNASIQLTNKLLGTYRRGFWPARAHPVGLTSQVPVFIVGFPGSGLSLLSSVLDSHKFVVALGENGPFRRQRPRLEKLLSRIISDSVPRQRGDANTVKDATIKLRNVSQTIGLEILDEYGRLIDFVTRKSLRKSGSNWRIIDASFESYRYIGLIHLVFPNAVILHTMRDPMDTLLSCYRTRFASDASVWTLDVHTMVAEYVMYLQVMQHFRSELPGRVIDVSYESLVAAPEATMRAILERMELPWDDAMLHFQDFNSTAPSGIDLVRKPFDSSKIGAWTSYSAVVQPLIHLLSRQLGKVERRALPSHIPSPATIRSSESFVELSELLLNWNLLTKFDYKGQIEALTRST